MNVPGNLPPGEPTFPLELLAALGGHDRMLLYLPRQHLTFGAFQIERLHPARANFEKLALLPARACGYLDLHLLAATKTNTAWKRTIPTTRAWFQSTFCKRMLLGDGLPPAGIRTHD